MYQVSFENTGADDLRWSYLRDYHKENYQFTDRGLRLRGTKITLDEADTPTFAGIRQSEFHTCLNVSVSGEAKEAGITFYMDESQHYDLSLVQEKGERKAVLRLRIGDAACIANTVDLPEGMEKVEFSVVSDPDRYEFYCMVDGEKKFLGSARTKYLSSEVAGGFTGVLMGLYAVDEDGKWAEFEELEWKQG